MPDTETVHGTCVAIGGAGVLMLGKPGSGKSSLALRLIDEPGYGISGNLKTAVLVADDQVVLRRVGQRVVASAPRILAGMLEIRGVGLVRVAAAGDVPLALVASLAPAAEIARLPEPGESRITVLDVGLPLVMIDAGLASAPARLRAAFDLLAGAH